MNILLIITRKITSIVSNRKQTKGKEGEREEKEGGKRRKEGR